MNDLKVFSHKDFGGVRAFEKDGQPWFVGKDVAEILGYGNGNKSSKALNNAVNDHVDADDKGVTKMDTPGGKQNLVIINESGLYSLILSSKLPKAKLFKRWVSVCAVPLINKRKADKFKVFYIHTLLHFSLNIPILYLPEYGRYKSRKTLPN